MARPIWKGSISFGLVNVPVVLYSAESRKELHFKLLDSRNNAPVHYERKNEKTGEEVPWNEIVKGYQYDESTFVLLGEEDFKRAAVEATQTIDIQDFVEEGEISSVYLDKPYYLLPGARGEKGYVLLRETLRRTKKAGIAKVVIRTREYLAALLVQDDAMVLELLRFHDELRNPAEFDFPSRDPAEHKISAQELKMAERLVESMVSEWAPEKYHDDYTEALLKWIEQKAQSGETAPAPAVRGREPAEVEAGTINIMDLLKRSVERTGKGRAVATASKTRGKTASRQPAAKKAKRKRAS